METRGFVSNWEAIKLEIYPDTAVYALRAGGGYAPHEGRWRADPGRGYERKRSWTAGGRSRLATPSFGVQVRGAFWGSDAPHF
jgi:hypothetical protein